MATNLSETGNINTKIINKLNQKKIIIKNLLKMFISRKLLENEKMDEIYNNLIKNYLEQSFIDIDLVTVEGKQVKILVTFIESRITSFKKIEDIEKKIKNGKKNIFIVNQIQNKIWQELVKNDIEVFFYHDFMINLIDHDFVPPHYLLTNDEKEKFLSVHNNNSNKLPKLLLYDPVVRYYKGNVGDIFKIVRPSITSGNNIYYRVVVNSPLPNYEI